MGRLAIWLTRPLAQTCRWPSAGFRKLESALRYRAGLWCRRPLADCAIHGRPTGQGRDGRFDELGSHAAAGVTMQLGQDGMRARRTTLRVADAPGVGQARVQRTYQ